MGALADGALAAGGEVFEVITRALEVATRQGFVRPGHRDLLVIEESPDVLLERSATWSPVRLDEWLDRTQR